MYAHSSLIALALLLAATPALACKGQSVHLEGDFNTGDPGWGKVDERFRVDGKEATLTAKPGTQTARWDTGVTLTDMDACVSIAMPEATTDASRAYAGMLFWLMGDMANARTPWPPLVVLALVVAAAMPFGRSLNVLARGPQQAAALGVAVRRMEWTVYVAAALITATAVTVAGSVGFVGLIVPHMLRLVVGYDQRIILPASALAGGTLLVLADTLARTIIAPEQLPVGVITAMLGVPVFLWLLHRSQST